MVWGYVMTRIMSGDPHNNATFHFTLRKDVKWWVKRRRISVGTADGRRRINTGTVWRDVTDDLFVAGLWRRRYVITLTHKKTLLALGSYPLWQKLRDLKYGDWKTCKVSDVCQMFSFLLSPLPCIICSHSTIRCYIISAADIVVLYDIQGGSNMTGTNCDLFTHNQPRSYLNHLVCNKLWFVRPSVTLCKSATVTVGVCVEIK
jgi:hypothetical protein